MNRIIQALELYLHDTLEVRLDARLWEGKDDLPFFFVNAYEFYRAVLWEHPCLLMIPKEGVAVTPAIIKKHRDQVQAVWEGCCIYIQETISSYDRQRLIHHRVPFIIPGNQMYLPDLGIDLREYFHNPRPQRELLSPATQAVVIYMLCHDPSQGATASALMEALGYSRMTLLRAFNELETAQVGIVERRGRDRYWVFKGSRYELWQQVSPLLSNPVKSSVWIKEQTPTIRAGLSALEKRSMLNPPTTPTYAINSRDWKRWQSFSLPTAEGAIAQLEVWSYDPGLFSDDDTVDVFSLYLSLKDIKDERVEAALDEMMENIEW